MEQQRNQKAVNQQQHEDHEEVQHGPFPVEQLQVTKCLQDSIFSFTINHLFNSTNGLGKIKGFNQMGSFLFKKKLLKNGLFFAFLNNLAKVPLCAKWGLIAQDSVV
jgi:hypothetical protein